jgi:hypothetical protein
MAGMTHETRQIGRLPADLGCLWLVSLFGSLFHLWLSWDVIPDVMRHRAEVPLWTDIALIVLLPLVAILSLTACAFLWKQRPQNWRRAFVSLRILLYCYFLLASFALYEAARTEALGAKLFIPFWAAWVLTTLVSVCYMLSRPVRQAFGVAVNDTARRTWWRLTWWP